MRADIATRRAHAPLPPIQINTSAPAPEIHTSFDDALLQVKTPNTQRFSISRPKPLPATPAFVISAQPSLPSVNSSRPSSRRNDAGPRQLDLPSRSPPTTVAAITAQNLDLSRGSAQRAPQRARPPLADALRGELLAEPLQDPKLRKSRSSLFSLFSRPNVERARGTGRTDRPLPERNPSRLPSRQPSVEKVLERQPSALSLKSHTSQSRSVADSNLHQPAAFEALRLPDSTEAMQRSKSSSCATWAPPPLFQAYPQSVKHSAISLHNASSDNVTGNKLSSSQSLTQERPKSRPGTARFGRPKSRKKDSADGDPSEGQSFEAFSQGSGSNKIYVLVTAGYLLQYAGEGSFDRHPEKVLRLTAKSAAFASDLIPGKHWVLQVVQSSADDPFRSTGAQRSFFHKFNMPGLKRKDVSGLLMTLDSPEDMDSWMMAIRKEIERMNGSRLQTATPRIADASQMNQAPKSPLLSHRFIALSRSPSTNLGPPSPLSPTSPTVVDSERTSGTTQVGTLSDITSEWSPRDFQIQQKISPYPTDHRSRENILEIPEPSTDAPETASIPLSPSSSIDDADFEYLFPPTPGSNRQSTFDPLPSLQNQSSTTTYTNRAHYSLSRQNSLKNTLPTTAEIAANSQRVSTYNLLPATSQRLPRQQSMPTLARQSSYPPPSSPMHLEPSSTNPRLRTPSPSAMESISESASFFNARNPSALPSPPLAAHSNAPSLTRAPSSHWTNGSRARQSNRVSLRAPMSADDLQQSANAARQNIESPDAVARRISARMSILHHAASHESLSSPTSGPGSTMSAIGRSTHTSSYTTSALGALPEVERAPVARQSSRMPLSTPPAPLPQTQSSPRQQLHSDQVASNNSSANSSRRTSFRSSGMPLPLQTSASATSTSANGAGQAPRTSTQGTGAATSTTQLSTRQRAILALQGVAESASAYSTSKPASIEIGKKAAPFRQPTPSSPGASNSSTGPLNTARPISIQVSSDRAPFLSTKRSPRASAQATTSPVELNSAPGNMQSSAASKRASTLVPIVRPPSLANHRLRAAGAGQTRAGAFGGVVGLPPQLPPPSMPLPMLPQESAQKV